MNKLQAAMRDRAANGWRESRLYYRVGSCFKGCKNCGEKEERGGRMIFVTGLNVFRSYKPQWMRWTYVCADCGAKDLACWADAWDVGREPRILPKSDVSPYRGEQGVRAYTQGQYSKEQRELRIEGEDSKPQPRLSERELTIMRLEARLEELRAMMAGGAR